ncbi:hypothetical protein GCM10027435_30030 [Haloparvum alkalitolerans]|uniref:DUF7538 family protein n=1 Tax=Haloparvum alkalitolerans TaxID=1042953 RepID=UPI003CF87AA4
MDDAIAALTTRESWRAEGGAARVHYAGATDDDRYAVEYYADAERVLYWRVPSDGATAEPVPRATVPDPLRRRVRRDLEAANVDPAVEKRSV